MLFVCGGAKYTFEYVNRFYPPVEDSIRCEFTFDCATQYEDSKGLEEEIHILDLR